MKKLCCNMIKDCTNVVTKIDIKGFIYCSEHGNQRKIAGIKTRKLTNKEIETLANGKPLGKF